MKKKRTLEIIFPKSLKKGDVIGLVTPSGVITKKQLKETIEKLNKLGFKTYHKPSVLSQNGYFAGTDKERADEIMHMFTNNKVDGILCVRGGYGAIRILDLLDFKQIKKNPKVFIGYSDITALHVSIYMQTGLVTFHGPVGTSIFNDFVIKSFKQVVMQAKKQYKYPYQREINTKNKPEFDLYTINKGKVKGELIGGNLSVLASMAGSAFEPDFENKIVFLEEIDEKTYKVDKMLIQLLQVTNLKKAAGIILGVFSDCNAGNEPRFTLKEAIAQILEPLNIPVSYGLPFGHIDTQITIPTGIKAKFNACKNSLKLIEKATK